MLFLFGLLLAMLGFALLVMGPVSLSTTWQVPGRVARVAGGIFVSFFPLVFALRFLIRQLDWEEDVNTTAINWVLFVLCLLGGGCWFLLVGRPAPRPRQRIVSQGTVSSPFDEPPPEMPAPEMNAPAPPGQAAPARKPPSRKSAPERNPFDFC